MMNHPAENSNNNSIVHRIKNGEWQYWSTRFKKWVLDRSGPDCGPSEYYSDPTVTYEDTWCEPEEDNG